MIKSETQRFLKEFRENKRKFNNSQQLYVIKNWISFSINSGNTELLGELEKEKMEVLKQIKIQNIGKRSFLKKISLCFMIFFRKLR